MDYGRWNKKWNDMGQNMENQFKEHFLRFRNNMEHNERNCMDYGRWNKKWNDMEQNMET